MTGAQMFTLSQEEIAARITARNLSKEIYAELAATGVSDRVINGKWFHFEWDDIRSVDIWQGNTFYDSVTSIEEVKFMIEEELLYGTHL